MVSAGFRIAEMGPIGGHMPAGPPRSASVTRHTTAVIFDAGPVRFVNEWLRDNCPCPSCRITQTDERRVTPWTLPPTDSPVVDVIDGELRITWLDGHQSVFTVETFAAIHRASSRGNYTARLWSQGYVLDGFEHDAAVNDHATRRQLFESFRRDGAILVTDSPTVPGTCMDLVRSLGLTLRDSSLGLIFDVKLNPAGFNVAFTAEGIPPHHDNAQYTQPPTGQVLAMLVNDATGGESIVVDSWSVVDELRRTDPAAVEVLSRVPVGFRQYSEQAEGFTRAPLITLDREGRCSHLRFSNQLMQPLPFDDPELAEWYRAYRVLGSAICDPVNQVSFRLRAGDMLFVNSLRVLHGRTEFIPDGPRHLQDIYFDVDDVFGNLDRMTGLAINAMVTS
jgi:gamma-butyrobetaine dioxygenase